jgi:signal transduction histidine kinase
MDATGANLLVNFYELSIITFLVMIYGLKRIWWIPLLTFSVNFLRLLYIHLYPEGDHWAVINNTFLSTFLEANISLWVILGISVFMIRKLGSTQRQLTEKNSALVASQKSLKRQRILLEKKEEAFLKLSEQNSHELRHPLSRLMAALSLVDSEESKEALPESYKAEFFKMVASTSVEEMKAKLAEIRKE